MFVTKKSKTYDILDSGIIQSFKFEPIEFTLNGQMKLEIIVEKVDGKASTIETRIDGNNNNKMSMIVTNPQITVNFGPIEPTRIAFIDKRPVFIAFRINTFGHDISSFELKYTFFVGQEE